MFKRDLIFRSPLLNAAGTLGFAPEPRLPLNWPGFGAFVTNPLSLRPRKPAGEPALIHTPAGFILHTGLPNPGLDSALKKYAPRWARADLPIIPHLMADRPEESARMVRRLETLENVLAVELGFAPQLSDDILILTVEMCVGEVPVIAQLPFEQVLRVGPRVIDAGAMAVSLAAPRGMAEGVSGRLYGPALFPQALLLVRDAARLGLPVIGGGGVYSKENASAMLDAGALAVQVDAALWRGDFIQW
jgi:dihydroorotate dehydrogenase (NAD+) catalytic subunit